MSRSQHLATVSLLKLRNTALFGVLVVTLLIFLENIALEASLFLLFGCHLDLFDESFWGPYAVVVMLEVDVCPA